MLSFCDFYLLLENQTVAQKLKSFDKNDVQKAKIKAKEEVDRIFHFQINEKKKQELINWYSLQLLDYTDGPLDKVKDYIASELNKINFNDSSLNFQKLEDESVKWHQELKNNRSIGRVGRIGTPIITFPDNWKWVMLDRASCEMEAGSMGHCGNAGYREGDIIYSLRDPKNIPYLTFVVNDGWIGESKGRFNKKPESRFHPYIAELLSSNYIKGIEGGGFREKDNFELDDLSPELKKKVLNKKPHINSTIKLYLEHGDYYEKNVTLKDALRIVKELNIKNVGELDKIELNTSNLFDYKNADNKRKGYFVYTIQNLYLKAYNTIQSTNTGKAWESLYLKNSITDKLINDAIAELNKNGFKRNRDFLDFIVYIRINYPNVFEKIYQKLISVNKNDIIVYFIIENIPFSEDKYYDLSPSSIKKVQEFLSYENLPIPDRLQSIIDYEHHLDQEDKEDSINKFFPDKTIDYIFDSVVDDRPISKKAEEKFNNVSLVSLEELKKIHNQISLPIGYKHYNDKFFSLITLHKGSVIDDEMVIWLYRMIETGIPSSKDFYDNARKLITDYLYRLSSQKIPSNNNAYYIATEVMNLLNKKYYKKIN